MIAAKWQVYSRLMRLDRPIGTLLLLWPTLWALWLASSGMPTYYLLLVFTAGVFLMRSAGCVINDFADRHFDGHVERTKKRPLPSGEVSEKECKFLFVTLVIMAFALVLTLNTLTIKLSVVALALASIYPFMKRITYLPQIVLGAAFGWSIPMAYAAAIDSLPLSCWLVFLANIFWTIAYDTQYAMVDKEDDIKINIKSTAILFGRFDRLIIGLLQAAALLFLLLVGYINTLGFIYYIALCVCVILFVYQQRLLTLRSQEAYFRAFMNNNYVGLVIFIGIALAFMTVE